MILTNKILNKAIIVFFVAVALVCCTTEGPKYHIKGEIAGLSDSTYVYLRISDSVIDSTLIEDKMFRFRGKVSKTHNANIFLKEAQEFKFIWLENSEYDFIGKKGRLKEARVKGGKEQSLQNELNNRKKDIVKSMDSIDLLFEANNISSTSKELYISHLLKLIDSTKLIEYEFIIDYPNSIVSAQILNAQKKTLDINELKRCYSLLGEETQHTTYGKLISDYIELYKNPQAGEKYIDFEQINQDNEKVYLSNLLGKFTLLDFWASWCIPCRKQNPYFSELYERYRGSGFQIVSVSLDENEQHWKRAILQDSMIWPNVSDLIGVDNIPATIYGIDGIPDNFLIDSTGIILARNITIEELNLTLEKLIR